MLHIDLPELTEHLDRCVVRKGLWCEPDLFAKQENGPDVQITGRLVQLDPSVLRSFGENLLQQIDVWDCQVEVHFTLNSSFLGPTFRHVKGEGKAFQRFVDEMVGLIIEPPRWIEFTSLDITVNFIGNEFS